MLNNQCFMYSVDTSFFYNKKENKINKNLNNLYSRRTKLKKLFKKSKDDSTLEQIKEVGVLIKKVKKLLTEVLNSAKGERELKVFTPVKHKHSKFKTTEEIPKRNIISLFESTLTRTIGVQTNALTEDLIVVQTYFFQVTKNIIENGFMYKGEKYVLYTASAGNMRNKLALYIKEKTFLNHYYTLMCGLSERKINEMGGININKYLAYLALPSSATERWNEFDITRTIVVNDMETPVTGLVDFIDDKSYKITRQIMDVSIEHTDGCGIMLPELGNKSRMIRLPWVKGLLVPFDFIAFIKENNTSPKIKDIYGKEWDVIEDRIQIILTKSQFKMHKYYKSWEDYCKNYLKYNCHVGICNTERKYIPDANINYQMLQTLTDITDEELISLSSKTNDRIIKSTNDKITMLRMLGVTKYNEDKTPLQQAIELYPAMLRDSHVKDLIAQGRKSMIKQAKSGKLSISGKYMYICPDLYAFCERLFLGIEKPVGLLKDGEVYSRIYKSVDKLDCLRSPHLYREHAVRNNVVDEVKSKWFITDGLYISSHDLISKLLQCDWDGDMALVVAENEFVDIAERNMKNIVPLYYNMSKADSVQINKENMYNGLSKAYSGANIGVVSNDITKIWNSNNVDLEAIKLRTMEGNFVVDYPKTLYKPTRPPEVVETMNEYSNMKTPYFFIHAKDKLSSQVEKINSSTVNKLDKIIHSSNKIDYKFTNIAIFNWKILTSEDVEVLDENIIKHYEKINKNKHMYIRTTQSYTQGNEGVGNYVDLEIFKSFIDVSSDIEYIVNNLVKYLYSVKKSKSKNTLWNVFGEYILTNIKKNTKKTNTYCVVCDDLITKKAHATKYCQECKKKKEREEDRLKKQRKRERSKLL